MTLEQKLAAVSDALGRPVTLTRLSEEDARADLVAAGRPTEAVEFTIALENDPPPVGSIPLDAVRAGHRAGGDGTPAPHVRGLGTRPRRRVPGARAGLTGR